MEKSVQFHTQDIISHGKIRTNFTHTIYSKSSKISNSFLFLFSIKVNVISAGIRKILVSIANWEDPDQTASEEAV